MKNITILYCFTLLLSIHIAKAQSKEQIYFEKAKNINTDKAYTDFLKKYPHGNFSQKVQDARLVLDDIQPVISTFLGNGQRNFYGNQAPEKLDVLWKLDLGEGNSPVRGKPKIWKGAGWTGQPLYVREKGRNYLILGAFDFNLKKIDAETGKIVWEYRFDDIIKGTGTLWVNPVADNIEKRYIIIQGSRLGAGKTIDEKYITSLRGISYVSGKELWRMNSTRTHCYSRDVDGSALTIGDTAYLALENGWFTVFSPDPEKAETRDGMLQAKIYRQIQYFNVQDTLTHHDDLVSESSPTLLNGQIFTPSGSGHVYGYNIEKAKNDFDLNLGNDMNGSAPATDDNCLIVACEKQFSDGSGGVCKINPALSGEKSILWYFPTETRNWYVWEGGIIGSAAVNDAYAQGDTAKLAVFIDVTGHLYVVRHDNIDPTKLALGPDGKTLYPMPQLIFDQKIEGTISTPIFVNNIIVAPTDKGLFLFRIDLKNEKLILLDSFEGVDFDASPIAVDGKIYIAGRDGFLYCFGKI